MRKTLSIRTRDGQTVASLEWRDGFAYATRVAPRMANDVKRWVEDGLDELVGEGAEVYSRSTPPSDAAFLDRLEAYLCRQFDFVTSKEFFADPDAAVVYNLAPSRPMVCVRVTGGSAFAAQTNVVVATCGSFAALHSAAGPSSFNMYGLPEMDDRPSAMPEVQTKPRVIRREVPFVRAS
jgi:hypothetical protein